MAVFLFIQFLEPIALLLLALEMVMVIRSIFRKKDVQIGVVGPQKTGKTLFLNALRGIWGKEPEQTTQMENYEIIEYHFSDGKTRTFRNCKDVPGSNSFIRTTYKEIIEESTILLFFCNMKQYLESQEYERDVNARLDYIYEVRKSINKDDKSLPVMIILSYADQVENRRKATLAVQDKLSGKDYHEMCCKYMHSINMTNEAEVKKLIEDFK